MEKSDFKIVKLKGVELLNKDLFTETSAIIYCKSGEATFLFNDKQHTFVAGTNFIVMDTVNLYLEHCTDDFIIYVLRFNNDITNRLFTYFDTSILLSLKMSFPDISPVENYLASNLTIKKMIMLLSSINESENKKLIMRSLMFCYLYETDDLVKQSYTIVGCQNTSYVDSTIRQFIELCRQYHKEHREIDFYSDKLHISRRYLHKIIEKKLNTTPKKIIDNYVVTSIKKLLRTTAKSNKEIADILNFPDLSTFSQYFRRLIGITPTEFRKMKY